MALDYKDRYPTQIDSDADYPQGKARNVTSPGSGDGTPWEKDLTNDVFGLLQSLLLRGSITPNGNPDTVTSAQYIEALIKAVRGPMAVANWDTQTEAAPSTQWGGAAWSPTLKLFAIVGTSGEIETSPNGRDWTTRTTPGSAQLTGIVWGSGPGRFVACGLGVIYTSSDGVGWSSQTVPGAGQYTAVAYDVTNGFVIVGVIGELAHSADGLTWSEPTSGTAENFAGVAFGGGIFVAVASNGVTARSANGSSGWILGTTGASDDMQGVTHSVELGRWVAVGLLGVIRESPNGIGSWSLVSTALTTDFGEITWCPELSMYVAVGSSGRVSIARNGTQWTDLIGADAAAVLVGVIYAAGLGRFVTVAANAASGIEASHAAGPLVFP